MKQLRQIALAATLVFGAANHAAGQAISNVLIPPQTIVGNVQGVSTGAQAIRISDLAVLLGIPPAPNCAAGTYLTSLAFGNVWVCAPVTTADISGLSATVATWLVTPNSANLAAAVTDETGTGALVFANSPVLITPNLGTPSSLILTNATGLPIATGVSGLGTGVATALGIGVGSTGSVVVNGGALGTPSSGTATNLTGLPIATGVSGLGAGVAAWAATPSSANLRTAVTDETGTGALYFQGGDIGTPSAGVGTALTALNASNLGSGTVAVARGGVDQTAFSAWSPTITCGTGTITTLGTVTGRQKQIGKIVFFYLSVTITTNGTCASNVNATLPVTSVNVVGQNGVGRENGVTGKMLAARILNNSTTLAMTFYDNTFPGANGAILEVSGFYETP